MTGPAANNPTGEVAALVAASAPRVAAPALHRRDAVLVTGPRRAGVSAVAAALRARLPDRAVVEELADGEAPAAVVFVVSAAAALTESDCALLDAAVAHTDAVIGVVAKADLHRHWPQMLQEAMRTVAGHAARYRAVPWVAVAAAPNLGEPRVDNLVRAVRKQCEDGDAQRRNKLREWEFQLHTAVGRYQRDAAAAGRRARMAVLRNQRDAALRQRRSATSERTMALRSRVTEARLQVLRYARSRCSSVRAELHEQAAGSSGHRLLGFEADARGRAEEVLVEVDRGVADRLADVAHQLGLNPAHASVPAELPELAVHRPALMPRRLETQLMLMLGAGFGLGVALTLSRLFEHLATGFTAAGAAACAGAGLAVTAWVVRTRGLLHDRAVLDRWVTELIAALRCAVEELVALRVLTAESAWSAALADRNEAEGRRLAHRIAVLDGELREHAAAAARAATSRDREVPALQRALDAVRVELETR